MNLVTSKSFTISGNIAVENASIAYVSATVQPNSSSFNVNIIDIELVRNNRETFETKLLEFLSEVIDER